MSKLEKGLTDSVNDQLADLFRTRVTRANGVLKSETPPMKDLRPQTWCYISKDSTPKRLVINFVSDSKQPDIYLRGGRPYGKRKVWTQKLPYRGRVDLANVTNGLIGGGTKRAQPLATHGWWNRAVKKAVNVIVKGSGR